MRPDACHGSGAGRVVRHQRNVAQTENLAETFVIPEQKRSVFLNRAAQRAAKNVALEIGNLCLIEEIPRIEGAIAQEFVRVAVKLVRAGSSHNVDLRAGALAVFGTISIL